MATTRAQDEGTAGFNVEIPAQHIASISSTDSSRIAAVSSDGIEIRCRWRTLCQILEVMILIYCTVVSSYLLYERMDNHCRCSGTYDDGHKESAANVIMDAEFSTTSIPDNAAPTGVDPGECTCNTTAFNSSFMELVHELKGLRDQVTFLNESMYTLKRSKADIGPFEDLNETVVGIETKTEALNETVVGIETKTEALNETVVGIETKTEALNETVVGIETKTEALNETVVGLIGSQLESTSMFAGWPDAITCNRTTVGSTIHFLVIANEQNNEMYWYRWIGWESYDKTSNHVFYPNGSYWKHSGDETGTSDCDGRSIQELYAGGMAFNFVVV